MIGSLRGVVLEQGADYLVLEVGGVGFHVYVPSSALQASPGIGKTFFLYTRLVVRQDSLSLYGFQDREQRDLFDLLLQISGIGPRLALAVLSYVSAQALRRAVSSDQPELLTRVPGVGKKTAQRIIFHLKEHLAEEEMEAAPPPSDLDAQVLDALLALGYNMVEAQRAVQSIPPDAPEDLEARLRLALQQFGA
jgi:Holliday junction DNA helicase RuvA